MGIFDFFKKKPGTQPIIQPASPNPISKPYKDTATNNIYNLLFCDDIDLYRSKNQPPYSYPFNILFSGYPDEADLRRVIDDSTLDARLRILALNTRRSMGHAPAGKELFGVIVEVGLEGGLDVLASFRDGKARYINQSGKLLIWDTTTDSTANKLTVDLFAKSERIIDQIGPWDKSRKPHPVAGSARITFLVSDGLYFGEGQCETLFNDSLAGPALTSATQLMRYLINKSHTRIPKLTMRKAATIVVLLISMSAQGQQTDFFKPGPVRRELKALPISGSIRIDGILDEPEWVMTAGATDISHLA
jgi:hypothetical protein